MGRQRRLGFNGRAAVVKQCAEIILMRLGPPGCVIRLGSPPFSPHCEEHNHRLKPHCKQSSPCSLKYNLLSDCCVSLFFFFFFTPVGIANWEKKGYANILMEKHRHPLLSSGKASILKICSRALTGKSQQV